MHKEFTIADCVIPKVTDGILEVQGPKLRTTTQGSAQKVNNGLTRGGLPELCHAIYS